MLDWLIQRPLSACCVQAASAYLQQHLLAGRGRVGAGGACLRGQGEAGEEILVLQRGSWLCWGGLGCAL